VITAQLVKELRELTGAGMMDCKRVLEETGGDLQKAAVRLRESGLAKAAKKAGRVTAEGLVDAYVHTGGKIAVLVEVNCETDFVARTDEFKTFVHDVALQVAAQNPLYVRREEVPAEVVEKQEATLRAEAVAEGKPAAVVERIVAGRMAKFFSEACLLDQRFIKDDEKTIGGLMAELISKLGENMSVCRFIRFSLGAGLPKRDEE
jgi:elongation factor Ts